MSLSRVNQKLTFQPCYHLHLFSCQHKTRKKSYEFGIGSPKLIAQFLHIPSGFFWQRNIYSVRLKKCLTLFIYHVSVSQFFRRRHFPSFSALICLSCFEIICGQIAKNCALLTINHVLLFLISLSCTWISEQEKTSF